MVLGDIIVEQQAFCCYLHIGRMEVLFGVHLYLMQPVWLEKLNSPLVTGVGLSWNKWWYCIPTPMTAIGSETQALINQHMTLLYSLICFEMVPWGSRLQRHFLLLCPIGGRESRLPVLFTATCDQVGNQLWH